MKHEVLLKMINEIAQERLQGFAGNCKDLQSNWA